MNNVDFSDKSSISGMESDHVTMQVLYQETIYSPSSKPQVTEPNLQKSKVCFPDKSPCQKVPHHPKPTIRPVLPPIFKFVELNIVVSRGWAPTSTNGQTISLGGLQSRFTEIMAHTGRKGKQLHVTDVAAGSTAQGGLSLTHDKYTDTSKLNK